MNNLQHQTYSPSTCECVIEQLVDYSKDPVDIKVWFFHNVCKKHEPIVKNKVKLSLVDWTKKRDDIVRHHELLLKENRERHLKTWDEHQHRKQMRASINEMKMSKVTERHALAMEAKLESDREKTVNFLDGHELESMSYLLTGLHSTYALISDEVYDVILEEQKAINASKDSS